jgi:hypothetical protein
MLIFSRIQPFSAALFPKWSYVVLGALAMAMPLTSMAHCAIDDTHKLK